MGELIRSISLLGYLGIWLMVGPIFALMLSHFGEKRWGNGPTWAWLGMFFNVFALLFFLLLAGYETSEARSTGALEVKRMRALVHATKGLHSFERNLIDNPNMEVQAKLERDDKVESLLAEHMPAEALAYARERRAVAFQLGDHDREQLYQGYIDAIETEDNERRANLARITSGGQPG